MLSFNIAMLTCCAGIVCTWLALLVGANSELVAAFFGFALGGAVCLRDD